MNLASRIAWVSDHSLVANPGGMSVQPLRFASHFPGWPCGLGLGLLSAAMIMVAQPAWWPLTGVFLGLNILFWARVRSRFRCGCMKPATVVSTAPLTLAVFTDLATGGGTYPVIKILHHPAPKGMALAIGDKCATVAVYNGYGHAEYWEGFTPLLVECATDSRSTIERVVRTIPAEEWSHLEEGLKHIPETLKLGQYPLRFMS